MDKLQWFKFSPSDWMMGKIKRCPEITQARFISLCCLYWNKECELSIEDAEIEIDEEHLDILFKKKVIGKDDNFIHINFLDEQFKKREDNSSEKSKSGSIGNLKRWHKELYNKFISKELSLDEAIRQSKLSLPDSDPIAPQSQNIAEKRRGEKRREEEYYTPPAKAEEEKSFSNYHYHLLLKNESPPQEKEEKSSAKKEVKFNFDKLLLFINEKTNRNFQVINQEVRRKYKARLKEGYTKEMIMTAIENAPKAQNHIDSNNQHLTVEFFSRAAKIDMYGTAVAKTVIKSKPLNLDD
jgi:uncharacterized phage protein (TIGR02220 family)